MTIYESEKANTVIIHKGSLIKTMSTGQLLVRTNPSLLKCIFLKYEFAIRLQYKISLYTNK